MFRKTEFKAPILAGRSEKDVIELILKACVDSECSDDNPFKGAPDRFCIWTGLARLLLSPPANDPYEPEWVSVKRKVHLDFFLTPRRVPPYVAHILDIGALYHAFFEDQARRLAYCWDPIYRYAYDGIPLYRKEHEEFVRLPESDPLIGFLKYMGQYSALTRDRGIPDWATDVYIRQSHMDAHALLFDRDYSEEQRAGLLTALHQVIGNVQEDASEDRRAPRTQSLMVIAEECRQKFWCEKNDLRKTSPKTIEVVDWLQTQYGLSARQAKAIDVVIRPRDL